MWRETQRRFRPDRRGEGWEPGDRNAREVPQWWNLLCANEAYAMHLFSASLETSTVSEPHILMTRAAAIGLVRLAQHTPRAGGLRAFCLVIHEMPVASVAASTLFRSPSRAANSSCNRISSAALRFPWSDT